MRPLLAVARSPLRALFIADHFDSMAKISEVDEPVFVVHGDADEVIAQSMGAELAERARHGHFFGVPGGSHRVQEDPATLRAFTLAVAD